MSSNFDSVAVERDWYEWWESSGLFRASSDADSFARRLPASGRTFSMILPPPNVTGELHVGHALTVAIQDAIVRRRRMLGDNVVWIPGLDHAGIATQAVVERRLRQRNQTRHDLGRDAFVDEVWQWRHQYGGSIVHQLRDSGASLDWRREFFSLDDARSRAVAHAFATLHDAGLVYRADRLVNWCCALQTVLSDIEVEHREFSGRTLLEIPGRDGELLEVGVMHYVAYPVELDDSEKASFSQHELIVGTTRPETLFADVALAVHSTDERYKAFHGRKVVHPLTKQSIPIIIDDILVDKELGTGEKRQYQSFC